MMKEFKDIGKYWLIVNLFLQCFVFSVCGQTIDTVSYNDLLTNQRNRTHLCLVSEGLDSSKFHEYMSEIFENNPSLRYLDLSCVRFVSNEVGEGGFPEFPSENCNHLDVSYPLQKLILPNNIIEIKDHVFHNYKIDTLILSGSLKVIGSSAFEFNKSLKYIVLPSYLDSIGESAFYGCEGLTAIDIPASVTSIGKSAFYGCEGLTEIELSTSLTTISEYSFSGCTSLTAIDIPASVSSIGDGAFYGCEGLTAIDIPASVTSIGGGAFSGCEGLTAIHIPNRVTSISGFAFLNCSGLTSIEFPTTLTSIGECAFKGCESLTGIDFPASVTSIGDGAFYGCEGLTAIHIPNRVTSISDYAFSRCIGLTAIYIPASVTSIGECAFKGCESLLDIELPITLTSIKKYTFYGCTGLTALKLPDSMTSIGDDAFYGCIGLTALKLPNSVTSIGDDAFTGCINIKKVEVWWKNPPSDVSNLHIGISCYHRASLITLLYRIIYAIKGKPILSIPYGTKSKYETFPNIKDQFRIKERKPCFEDSVWRQTIDTIAYNDLLTTSKNRSHLCLLGEGLDCSKFHKYMSEIFENNPSLRYLDLSGIHFVSEDGGKNYLPSFPNTNMYHLDVSHSLEKLILPNNIIEIRENAFSTYRIDTIVLPDSLKVIGSSAFKNNFSLKYIVLPSDLDSVGRYAFLACRGLTAIKFPNSVTSIGAYAFSDCRGLTAFELPSNIASIGDGAFSDCISLTALDFSNSSTSIGAYAFYGCSGLTSIKLPQSVTSIGAYAFSECVNIKRVEVYWQDPPSDVSNLYFGRSRYYSAPLINLWRDMKYAIKRKPILSVPYGTKSKYEAFSKIKEQFRIKERKR